MTDAEIIKALECCCNTKEMFCSEKCPLYNHENDCFSVMKHDVLELINRQKAKISHYKNTRDKCSDNCMYLAKQCDKLQEENQQLKAEIERLQAESVKEFAKFLIDNCKNGIIEIDDLCDYVKEKTDFNPYDFSKMFLNCGELKPINTEIAGDLE